jgi:hypothetical protein
MHRYVLRHLDDGTLLRNLGTLAATDRTTTAELLAHIAEVERRRLYAPAGSPSMHDYCVRVLRMSEDVAYKRIRVARMARKCPAIFAAVADGRLHLSGLVALAPRLTSSNARELLGAAVHKTRREIEQMLAERFPQSDVPTVIAAIPPLTRVPCVQLAPGPVARNAPGAVPICSGALPQTLGESLAEELAPGPVATPSAGPADPVASSAPVESYPRVSPLSAERFALQVTISREVREKLARAQELLGFTVPAGDVAVVLGLALDALVERLERDKCAATDRPRRASARASRDPRHVPAAVKRAVRARDGDQCAFVSDSGRRCTERKGLEFDHVEPVARGGGECVTAASVRLLCRAHNQYEADRILGRAFMDGRRAAASENRAARASVGGAAPSMAPGSTPSSALGHHGVVG